MEVSYKKEIASLEQEHMDVAFLVLDPRQEERYWWGFNEFMNSACADIVFPMHLWENYKLIEQFKNDPAAENYKNRIMSVEHEQQIFEI